MSEDKLNLNIGKNIKKYRYLYNATKGEMKQKDLASKVGVSTSTIGALESPKVNQGVSLYNLYKISKVLGVSIDQLVE